MRKQASYLHNWVEVAPSPLISPHKASNAPRLETIAEEGSEKMEIIKIKAALLLPIVLSFASYLLLYRSSII
ncbi:hypothetical protein CDL12_16708 [Handroanthus impetiginosus]|uniref:Uncharacterized protein n=1 Tax=Handroanthus impetiginosus TaxID=429701 RepID=A0A2G9GZH3_9LAMI|nr:hypothetical protein CDL12_16708 [Handroanthus impetiginosus]